MTKPSEWFRSGSAWPGCRCTRDLSGLLLFASTSVSLTYCIFTQQMDHTFWRCALCGLAHGSRPPPPEGFAALMVCLRWYSQTHLFTLARWVQAAQNDNNILASADVSILFLNLNVYFTLMDSLPSRIRWLETGKWVEEGREWRSVWRQVGTRFCGCYNKVCCLKSPS